jgi:hypothetical protein
LSYGDDINKAWENIKENFKTSANESLGMYELKQHKPWFDDKCLGVLDQRKQAKRQWVQDQSQSNIDNLNNVRHKASRHFRNKNKEYLKAKIEELETNSKIKNIRHLYFVINYFKKSYQPITNMVKDEKGDMVTDSHSILARWRNHFSYLLNIRDDRQAEIHTAEPLVPEPSATEVELAIESEKVTNHQVLIKSQQN